MPAVAVEALPELVVAHAEEAALAESVVAVLRARLRCRELVAVNVRAGVAMRPQRAPVWCPRVAAEDRAEQLIGRAGSQTPDQAAIVQAQAELAIDLGTLPAVPVGSAIDQIQLIDRESAIVLARAVAPMPAPETGPDSVIDQILGIDLDLEIDQTRITARGSVIVPTAAIDRE